MRTCSVLNSALRDNLVCTSISKQFVCVDFITLPRGLSPQWLSGKSCANIRVRFITAYVFFKFVARHSRHGFEIFVFGSVTSRIGFLISINLWQICVARDLIRLEKNHAGKNTSLFDSSVLMGNIRIHLAVINVIYSNLASRLRSHPGHRL